MWMNPLQARGNTLILLKRCCAMYLNSSRTANSVIVFDATHSTRVAQITKVDQMGADEIFRIADYVSGYKLNVKKRKQESLVCFAEVLILAPFDCTFDCTP